MNGQIPEVTKVRTIIQDIGGLLVAFSGGVDSTVLLKLALEELGAAQVLAVTAHGDVHTTEELESARRIASEIGARHMIIDSHELEVPGFSANPPERCFLCRSAMYAQMVELARREGLGTVVDGANRDDGADYRPGIRAAKTLGVRSPLTEAGLGKTEVRALARDLGLSNWDLPASPCLSSRFPYGEEITKDKLEMVATAERRLRELGFATARVRHHGDLARIEVLKSDIPRAAEESVCRAIVGYLRDLGYAYVTVDLEGFRSGSMNETLQPALRSKALMEGEA
ncbi:MAG: ATP-dependent sacrificial sulfur transferase LarE [bacterium]